VKIPRRPSSFPHIYLTSVSLVPNTAYTMAAFQPWAIIIFVLLGCALLSVIVAGLGKMYMGDTSATVESRPGDVQAGYMREVRERNQMDIMHKAQRGRPKMNMQRSDTNYTDYSSATEACEFYSFSVETYD
jgi:hypothetical protein